MIRLLASWLRRMFDDTDQAEEHDLVQLDASDGVADGKYTPDKFVDWGCSTYAKFCPHCKSPDRTARLIEDCPNAFHDGVDPGYRMT